MYSAAASMRCLSVDGASLLAIRIKKVKIFLEISEKSLSL